MVTPQEGGGSGGEGSVSSPTYLPPTAGPGAGAGPQGALPEYSVIGRPGESPLMSAAPSEASDSIVVSQLNVLLGHVDNLRRDLES